MLFEGLIQGVMEWGINPEVGIDARVIDEMPRSDLANMARDLENAGSKCTVHGPFMDLSPGSIDPGILSLSRERFEKGLELAALFSPGHIVFHAGFEYIRYGYNPERWLEISLETWTPLARRAKELGFPLLLENVYEKSPDEMAPLLEALSDEGVGFCFDIGHATACGDAPVSDWLDRLTPYIKAMHLHDNNGLMDDHLAIGQGIIDFKSFFNKLLEKELKPRVVMEPHEEDQLWAGLVSLADLWPWDYWN